jgi:putative FmdB family regulatory protein
MPLYEYRCAKCGHVMEVLEKADATDRHACEKCGSHRMERLMSTFGVRADRRSSGDSCPTGTCSLS